MVELENVESTYIVDLLNLHIYQYSRNGCDNVLRKLVPAKISSLKISYITRESSRNLIFRMFSF